MLTEKDYCDYDTSIALGELGFPLKRMKVKNFIDGQFSDSIVTVLLYEAQKWLREGKKVIVTVNYYCKSQDYNSHWFWAIFTNDRRQEISSTINYSYEEALSKGIKEAVKILKGEGTC